MNDYELLLEYNKILQLEVEKLNHYKTLYNILKDRKDKAIEYIKCENIRGNVEGMSWLEVHDLLKILKGEE